ncbi:MAG: DNA-processing protein DprA [Bacteroidaceae bacterium]
MTEQEILCSMALARLPRMNMLQKRMLVKELGSATAVYAHRHELGRLLDSESRRLEEALKEMDNCMARAHEEMEFVSGKRVKCLCFHDKEYPVRLRECPDAPILLYASGNAHLNARHIVGIVGTRQATDHGRTTCRKMVERLAQLLPGTLVVSGLAYGIDVEAHRAALACGLPTVGILAHGLDQIYPRVHRETAVQMLQHGGLVTEFMSRTNADKKNFVQRNRIVAGMCDAIILIESASKGGSLITTSLAESYDREVFAVPGRPTDKWSEGCNTLIRRHKAHLLSCIDDMVEEMGWDKDIQIKKQLSQGLQQQLFPDLSPDETAIFNALKDCDYKHINQIAQDAGLPMGTTSTLLFEMEMKGIVHLIGGNIYRLS